MREPLLGCILDLFLRMFWTLGPAKDWLNRWNSSYFWLFRLILVILIFYGGKFCYFYCCVWNRFLEEVIRNKDLQGCVQRLISFRERRIEPFNRTSTPNSERVIIDPVLVNKSSSCVVSRHFWLPFLSNTFINEENVITHVLIQLMNYRVIQDVGTPHDCSLFPIFLLCCRWLLFLKTWALTFTFVTMWVSSHI